MQTISLDYRVAWIPGLGYGWFQPEAWERVPLTMRDRVQVLEYHLTAESAARRYRELSGGEGAAVTPWMCLRCGGEGKRIIRRAGPAPHLVSWLECRRCGLRGDFRDSEAAQLQAGREREE
jgi:hypothetical protein